MFEDIIVKMETGKEEMKGFKKLFDDKNVKIGDVVCMHNSSGVMHVETEESSKNLLRLRSSVCLDEGMHTKIMDDENLSLQERFNLTGKLKKYMNMKQLNCGDVGIGGRFRIGFTLDGKEMVAIIHPPKSDIYDCRIEFYVEE